MKTNQNRLQSWLKHISKTAKKAFFEGCYEKHGQKLLFENCFENYFHFLSIFSINLYHFWKSFSIIMKITFTIPILAQIYSFVNFFLEICEKIFQNCINPYIFLYFLSILCENFFHFFASLWKKFSFFQFLQFWFFYFLHFFNFFAKKWLIFHTFLQKHIYSFENVCYNTHIFIFHKRIGGAH